MSEMITASKDWECRKDALPNEETIVTDLKLLQRRFEQIYELLKPLNQHKTMEARAIALSSKTHALVLIADLKWYLNKQSK